MKLAEWLLIIAALPALIVVLILMKVKESLVGPTYWPGGGAAESALMIVACVPVGLCFWGYVVYQLITHLRWV